MDQIYTDRINQIINDIREDKGDHFRMSSYSEYLNPGVSDEDMGKYIPCNTSFCIGGWANLHRLMETNPEAMKTQGFSRLIADGSAAAEWLGMGYNDAHWLFHMGGSNISMAYFDDQPLEARRAAGVRVLEILRDTGIVNWPQALSDAGIDPEPDDDDDDGCCDCGCCDD